MAFVFNSYAKLGAFLIQQLSQSVFAYAITKEIAHKFLNIWCDLEKCN